MIASHHSFGLRRLVRSLGLARSRGTAAGCGTIKFPKLFDKIRIRLYQVSNRIHLKTSMKNLVKTE
jgi:hypothetical protein